MTRQRRQGEVPHDVPSPIDFCDMTEARDWEARAEQRPGRREILDRITQVAAELTGSDDRILELGSGPGFLAERLLARLPDIHYTALDLSAAMHELARARLDPWLSRVTFLERNMRSDTWADGLGPFQLVVTNQAVHELRHKRHAPGLHRRVLDVLVPGGHYLVADHFSDPGGLENAELYMTRDEQMTALRSAGFASVERLAVAGSLVLHLAATGTDTVAASHHDLQMSGRSSVWVDVPPRVAFAALTDLTRMGEWSPENIGGEWVDGPPGEVGSVFRGRNRAPHGEWETELTVTECVENEAFSFRVAPPGLEGTTWRYTFEAEGRGTRVAESFQWRWTPVPDEGFRGRIGRMPLPQAQQAVSERARHLQRSADTTMAALKARLEASSRAD